MRLFLALASLVSLLSQTQAQTLVDVVVATEDLAILETAVVTAGLAPTLSGEGPFTVFAPTNSSFEALPPALLGKLLEPEWILHLQDVLLYHVTNGNVSSTDLSDGLVVTMANDETIDIGITDVVSINGAAEVVLPNVYADNGVAHVINAVLTPSFISTTIVDIASTATTTLANLVVRAGLDDDLSADGALTVFAPTNDAFAALDQSLVAFLESEAGTDILIATLTYHVIPSVIPSVAIVDGPSMVASLEGTELSIVKSASGIRINDAANVVLEAADVLAINGIVHVIDSVLLLPEDPEGTAAPTGSPIEGTAAPSEGSSANKAAAFTFGVGAMLAIVAVTL